MHIREIDFGRDTAESDLQLRQYFLQTLAFQRAMSGERSIITGRKGSGKSAILRYAVESENPSNQYVVRIEASHATYAKLDETLRALTSQIKNLDSSFKHAWLFTTLISLLDRLVEEQWLYVTKEERELYEFAKETYRYTKDDPIAAMAGYVFSWVKGLKTIGPVGRDVSTGQPDNLLDEPRLLNLIRNAIKRVSEKGRTTYLFYDKLDERWDGSPLYIAFLQGLFLAMRDIVGMGLNVVPVILIRDDIWDAATADFQHVDHFRMFLAPITWDETSLLDLIALRIRTSLTKKGHRIPAEDSSETVWRLAFSGDIPAKKQAVAPWIYMIERTLFRPRDIILFANTCRDVAIGDKSSSITPEHVLEAETQYSTAKLRDLVAEVSYKYPAINKVIKEFRLRKVGYSLDELQYVIMEIKDKLGLIAPWIDVSEDDIVRILYQIGFLSYTTKGGILRGTRVIHSGVSRDEDAILEQSRLFISPIYRKALDLKDH